MSTSNSKHGSFLFINNENTYPKGRALMQMYRVVPQTKRGYTRLFFVTCLSVLLIFKTCNIYRG